MKKVLLVDDDNAIAKSLHTRLRTVGYDVVVANDGLFAVKLAHEYGPDIILLDYRLPAGSGVLTYEVLQLSSETFGIPVIIMTAFDEEGLESKFLEMGVEAYISKPFEIEELLALIKKYCKDK